jgi:ankyrin repeat protein
LITPLHLAAEGGHLGVVKLLIDYGAERDLGDMVGGYWILYYIYIYII